MPKSRYFSKTYTQSSDNNEKFTFIIDQPFNPLINFIHVYHQFIHLNLACLGYLIE